MYVRGVRRPTKEKCRGRPFRNQGDLQRGDQGSGDPSGRADAGHAAEGDQSLFAAAATASDGPLHRGKHPGGRAAPKRSRHPPVRRAGEAATWPTTDPQAGGGGGRSSVIAIPAPLWSETIGIFRSCGGGRLECVAYWMGPASDHARITRVVHPQHTATPFHYRVDDEWL